MKIAHLVRAFVLLAIVGCASAQAQSVRIVRATYGVQGQSIDVTRQIQSHVNRGQFSFPVTNRFFGVDPAPGRNKGVAVTYVVNGRQFTQQATENSTFTFRHVGPPAPGPTSQIRFVSQRPALVRIYQINSWGGWQFMSNLTPGGRFSVPARAGERFIVTDSFHRILREVSARRGGETVVIR